MPRVAEVCFVVKGPVPMLPGSANTARSGKFVFDKLVSHSIEIACGIDKKFGTFTDIAHIDFKLGKEWQVETGFRLIVVIIPIGISHKSDFVAQQELHGSIIIAKFQAKSGIIEPYNVKVVVSVIIA